MTNDLHTLQMWIRVVIIIAAVCTTSMPIIYAFSPWWSSNLGRIFMMKAISFALAMDMTALFSFWHPKNIFLLFWLDAIVLTAIAASTAAMTVLICLLNYKTKKGENQDAAQR